MKLFNALLANVLLAGGLLAVPALAADKTDNTISSGTRTDVLAEGPGGPGAGEGRGEWRKGPHFTDDQLVQMASLKDKYFAATAPQRTQLMTLHRQLRSAMAKADINRSEVLSLQSQMNAIRDDLSTKKMNEKLDFIALLTPEQKEHFRHHMLIANAFGGHHKWGHQGGGCGGGGMHRGHHHKMGQGGPGGEQPKVGFDAEGPGPVAFDGPAPMGPEVPDAE